MSSRSDPIDTEGAPLRAGPCMACNLLGLLGLGLFAAGGAIALGVLPASWVARADGPAAAAMSAGVALLGFVLLARSTREQSLALARSADPTAVAQWLDERLAELDASLGALRELQQVQGNALGSQEQKLELLRQETRAGFPKDAVFRLAASLDQLAARVDLRAGEAQDVLQRALLELDARVDGVRVELERRFQETIHSIGTLSAEETLASTFDDGFGAASGPTTSDVAPGAGELSLELERERPAAWKLPGVDLGVLEKMAVEPASRDREEQPVPLAPLPAPLREEPLAAPVEPARPPASIPFPRSKESLQPEGWWSDADRARRG